MCSFVFLITRQPPFRRLGAATDVSVDSTNSRAGNEATRPQVFQKGKRPATPKFLTDLLTALQHHAHAGRALAAPRRRVSYRVEPHDVLGVLVPARSTDHTGKLHASSAEAGTTVVVPQQGPGFVPYKRPSVHLGYYIAHILTNAGWAFFDDEKVARADTESIRAIKTLAYLYIFERVRIPAAVCKAGG
ncbi:hypothetical protein EDB89DRAFT_2074629 [Lactarius sanguifluus]|nr:hypothetical protein EDB89DRAFT_2074629 [Lactarius sanguifluus]